MTNEFLFKKVLSSYFIYCIFKRVEDKLLSKLIFSIHKISNYNKFLLKLILQRKEP